MTLKLKFKPKQRVLITSDIHGNLDLFQKMLRDMNFSRDDVLILNGDMVEKGTNSVGLMLYILELRKTHTIYATLGNCDELLNFLRDDTRNLGMENYMNTRPRTILSEFREIFKPYSSFQNLKDKAMSTYADIFDYILDLPDIIQTPYFTVVHAGLQPDGDQSHTFNVKEPRFLDFNYQFRKPVVVGHYPVCLYNKTYLSYNPILNLKKNIFSIDGGNVIKEEGQLNVLEFIDDEVQTYSFDLLEYSSIPLVQKRLDGHHISWDDRDIEILEVGNEFSLCRHLSTRTELQIYNDYLDFDYEILKEDYTDSLVEVKEEDRVHIIFEASIGYYVKCGGYVGWLLKEV